MYNLFMEKINYNNKTENKRWGSFFEKTKGAKPRKYLIDAIQYIENKKIALDLGAGTLPDTRFLLEQGFEKVIAIDKEEVFKDFAKAIDDERLEANISSFEDFDYKEKTYDLINAQYSLPFMKQEYFDDVIFKIKNSLKTNGVFVGTFFGIKDSWNNETGTVENFQTKEELLEMFEDFELLEFLEEEDDKSAVNEKLKHWHTFHITAKKP